MSFFREEDSFEANLQSCWRLRATRHPLTATITGPDHRGGRLLP